LSGTPFVEITSEVLRERHDLVVLNAEEGVERRRWLFGSTSMHLMRKCPCSVWVMKPGQSRFQRIMACVDPDPETKSPQKEALDEKVLQLATSLARRESARLDIVHAWHLAGEQMLRRRSSSESIEGWANQTEAAHRNELDQLMGRVDVGGLDFETHLVKGMPRDVLSSFAANHEVDLVVMGTVCRTGIAGLLIGNTAELVLQQVNCSALAVKPDGFVSPITL
jgi:nucleotide-binding universal stress UspA family protein